MSRFSSAWLAIQLACAAPVGAVIAQQQLQPEPQTTLPPPRLTEVQLPAARPNQAVDNLAEPELRQLVRALGVDNANVVVQGRLLIRNVNLPANARCLLSVVEVPGGVRFHVRSVINRESEALPHKLLLDKEQSTLIVRHFADQCTVQCQALSQICDLSAEQWDKLHAAAVVDATRFMRQLRHMFDGTREQQQASKLNPLQLQQAANRELMLGIRNPSALFRKILFSQITSEQYQKHCRWWATELFSEIDRHADLALDAQVRLLKVNYPQPGQAPQLYEKLNVEQRDKLLALIVAQGAPQQILIEWIDRPHSFNLLADIESGQLVGFLTPVQVQAVMRQKAMLASRQQYLDNFRQNAQAGLEVGGVAIDNHRWQLIPVR